MAQRRENRERRTEAGMQIFPWWIKECGAPTVVSFKHTGTLSYNCLTLPYRLSWSNKID